MAKLSIFFYINKIAFISQRYRSKCASWLILILEEKEYKRIKITFGSPSKSPEPKEGNANSS